MKPIGSGKMSIGGWIAIAVAIVIGATAGQANGQANGQAGVQTDRAGQTLDTLQIERAGSESGRDVVFIPGLEFCLERLNYTSYEYRYINFLNALRY